MGLLDWGKAQFLDIIQWLDDSKDVMAWRFPMQGQEIQNGGKLVVRESQEAVFVNEGQFADVFKAGTHNLTTQNLPILVYFTNTRLYNDLGWGTTNPVMMRDADFGAVRLRAHGIFSLRVVDSAKFLKELVGTNGVYTVDDVSGQLRGTILSSFSDLLGEMKIPALDLASKYEEISKALREKMAPEFQTMGLDCAKLVVKNIALPEEVEAMLDKRSSVGMMAPVMGAYTQMQVADSIPLAAQNPGGLAGMGMGLGVGVGMGNMMGQQMGGAMGQMAQAPYPAGNAPAAPATPAAPAKSLKDELTELKDLFDSQLISQAEFDAQRGAIMKKHGMGN